MLSGEAGSKPECADSAPGMRKSQAHIDDVSKYLKQSQCDLDKRKAEYEKVKKEADTALHAKMINLEGNLRKEMEE